MTEEQARGGQAGAASGVTQETEFAFLLDRAREWGADGAALLPAHQIVVDERVRLKCAVPVCHGYGNYLHCPPNTFTVAEFRTIVARFSTALLVQVESPQTSVDLDDQGLAGKDTAKLEAQLHGDPVAKLMDLVARLEAEAFKAGYYYATGFGGGLCLLCPTCVGVGSGQPCRRPFEARPSMEGVGIDVFKTAANAGLPIALSADSPVKWTALLLVN